MQRFTIPAIAQLVEHLTVDSADIRWSLVRFRVAGFVMTDRGKLIRPTQIPLCFVYVSPCLASASPTRAANKLMLFLGQSWICPARSRIQLRSQFRDILCQCPAIWQSCSSTRSIIADVMMNCSQDLHWPWWKLAPRKFHQLSNKFTRKKFSGPPMKFLICQLSKQVWADSMITGATLSAVSDPA